MSELAQVAMDADAARRLTERIRIAAVNYSEAKEKLLRLVSDAKEGAAHVALGYRSWQAYLADVLGEEPMRLTRDERPEVVQMLSEEDMSTRAIASIVGTSYDTVQRDIRTDRNLSVDEPRVSHGMDGKTRVHQPRTAQPEPPKSKRRPLKDSVDDAGWNLRRAVERLNRVTEDDRFEPQKNEMATHLRSHLENAVEVCQDLLDSLNK